MIERANYRKQWAEGEIEVGTLLDAIDSLHEQVEALREERDSFQREGIRAMEVTAGGPYASLAEALAQRYPKPSLLKDCNVTYSNSSRPLADQGERQEAVATIEQREPYEDGILVIIEGEPVGKGRPRAFRAGAGVRMFTPGKTRAYEEEIAAEARKAMAGRPPLIGPCMLELTMVFSVPASWSKAKRAAALAGEIVPTKKPDADNVIKALCDAFNAIVWLDDVQVTDLVARKRFGEAPHVQAIITPLNMRGST